MNSPTRHSLVRTLLGSLSVCVTVLLALGWGHTGHTFINTKAAYHLPSSMAVFIADSTFFGQHGSDADNRKGSDTSEARKHYIDIENYPSYAGLTGNLDSLIALYGYATVKANGTLPWATVWAYDSLVAQLKRGAMSKAESTAADLGHYVGDGHMPLHITTNYDGQITGNNGIHSRYESSMIDRDSSQLRITPASCGYVGNRFAFVMNYLLQSHTLVDSILQADDAAKAASGWGGLGQPPDTYYAELWNRSQFFTLRLIQNATLDLASLWYSANADAGTVLPVQIVSFSGRSLGPNGVALFWTTLSETNNYGFEVQKSVARSDGFVSVSGLIPGQGTTLATRLYTFSDWSGGEGRFYRLKQIDLDGSVHYSEALKVTTTTDVADERPVKFALQQNYPNPFNPSTSISFATTKEGPVSLRVYDILGREVATLVNENRKPGQYTERFDGSQMASGMYVYVLKSSEGQLVGRMMLSK